jgi:hypothetical protein
LRKRKKEEEDNHEHAVLYLNPRSSSSGLVALPLASTERGTGFEGGFLWCGVEFLLRHTTSRWPCVRSKSSLGSFKDDGKVYWTRGINGI